MIRSILNHPYSLSSIRWYFRVIYRALRPVPFLAAATAEALLRRDFGMRYVPTLLGGWAFLFFIATLLAARAPFLALFSLIIGVKTALHAASAWLAAGRTRRHSRSAGEPSPLWTLCGLSPAAARGIGEPAVCLAAGTLTALIDPVLSIWLTTAAAGLMLKELSARWRLNQRTADATDARIEAEQFGEAVNRRMRPQDAQGDRPHRARIARSAPNPRPH